MKVVSVSDLKAHLSRYVGMARRGSEIQISERGVPVARLVGLAGSPRGDERERVDRLARAGILRRGTGELAWVLQDPPVCAPAADLGGALAEDRGDRV